MAILTRRKSLQMAAVAPLLLPAVGRTAPVSFVLGTTTSLENSGFLDRFLGLFQTKSGVIVQALVAGTGRILELARRGDLSATLTHHPKSEQEFVRKGLGKGPFPLFTGVFFLLGPQDDPAEVRSAKSVMEAFARIAQRQAPFVSRGDDSGTHKKEMELWRTAGIQPQTLVQRQETGSGMAATLRVAIEQNAYCLSDGATWSAQKTRGNLEVLWKGSQALENPYAAILIEGEREKPAASFIQWLQSPEAQEAIAKFRVGESFPFRPVSSLSSLDS